jgi:hypothetical protein
MSSRGGQANLCTSAKQIRKFLGSFRSRKSANSLGVPVRKSASFMINPQIANPQISTKYFTTHVSPQRCLIKDFSLCTNLNKIIICYICKEENFKSANHNKKLGPQIANPLCVTFAENRKSNRLFKSRYLRI